MRKKTLLLVLITAFLVAPSTFAQVNTEDQKEVLIDSAEVERKAVISVNLNFTDEESKVFWPAYNQYRKDVKVVNDSLIKLIEKYGDNYESLSDELATELMFDAMSIEEDRMILKEVYVEDLAEIIPMRKVFKLYQIENKIDAALRAELAITIPFIRLSDEDVSK